MASVNKVILLGNLGRDPETRYTTGGDAVTNLNIATSEQWKDKSGEKQERTEWHRVVLFGRQAEIAGEYLKKGRSVYIEGRLQTRKYTDKDGVEKYSTEIVADRMQLIGSAREGGGARGCRVQHCRRGQQRRQPATRQRRRRRRRCWRRRRREPKPAGHARPPTTSTTIFRSECRRNSADAGSFGIAERAGGRRRGQALDDLREGGRCRREEIARTAAGAGERSRRPASLPCEARVRALPPLAAASPQSP